MKKSLPQLRPFLVSLFALTLAACGGGEPPQEMPPPIVSTIVVETRPVHLEDELPGRVSALRTAEIRPQVGGIVLRRLFEQGAEVQAGQPLFQINPAPFKAEVDSAASALKRAIAAMERAKLQVDRLKPLVDADAVSQQLFDDALSQYNQSSADVAQAKAALARRQLDLDFATIRSPIAGRIGEELVTEGALVGQSDANPMARVQQIDQVYVDVRQPASMLEAIRKSAGQSASSDGGKDGNVKILDAQGNPYPVSGHILFSGINVDAGTGDVVIRIRVNNPERHLLPGTFVRAKVPQGGDIQGLLVPQQAVSRSSTGQARIWVVGQDGKAGVKNVELGKLVERQYLVRNGLVAGERVIVEGQDRLQPGMPVSAQPWALAADGKTVAP
ncbi:multidrug efflux system membrane fusion protein [Azospira oryzae]|uniref:Multidrug efflux system membrane fusion protein n=1 Tax=Azospira oryzae TaxID=146939 RepID=A0ABY0IS04_9RHOO|nr:efflux RND transporter periplasmic adaptor subunit [Azospira oryzae]RZT90380.1 multidrug efflux system membrane fusion protein [Azospira oryzae]